MYLNNGSFGRNVVETESEGSQGPLKIRQVGDLQRHWEGIWIKMPQTAGYYDVSEWINSYSPTILMEAYGEWDQKIELKGRVSTEFYGFTEGDGVLQLSGRIANGSFDRLTEESVEFVINLVNLPKQPMTPRIGDRRIGYFYQEILNREDDGLFQDPYIIIDRRNVAVTPWVYLVDPSIPERFRDAVRAGVTHWNKYFKRIGLGSPLKIVMPDSRDFPKDFDCLDPRFNYVVNHDSIGLNGSYTGVSQDFVDFRSGEILFGNIYLNFKRMETIGNRYFRLYQTRNYSQSVIKKAIDNCIIWVVGHEIGHQLGLRHNFVGNEMDDGYGSIMDYVEFFDNFEKFIEQDYDRLRTYDLHVIRYGYTPLKGESLESHHKPSELEEIAAVEVPFKTDDNYFNGIIPNVGRLEDERDILSFIGKAIANYRDYRLIMLDKLSNDEINSYQYANGFLFIYINRYRVLSHMLCKYIGGRFIDFRFYHRVSREHHIRSLSLLLRLKQDLKYSNDEYEHLIYDFNEDIDAHSPVVKVSLDQYNYYGYNSTDLFLVFQELTWRYMRQLTRAKTLIRLNGGQQQRSLELLYDVTFCVDDENDIFEIQDQDGIFPEIGLLVLGNKRWKTKLLESDVFDQYSQYQWIDRLVSLKQGNKHYFIQTAIDNIFAVIMHYGKDIRKYLEKLDNRDSVLLSHYRVIWEKITKTRHLNYTW